MLAGAARLGADPAVLVVPGVRRALIPAGAARLHAGLEHGAGEVGVVASVPGQDPGGGVADVGAVEVGAAALAQLLDHVVAHTGIRARGTGLRAGATRGHHTGETLPGE